MLCLHDFAREGISPERFTSPLFTGEEQLFTLKDNVTIKSMSLISHENIHDGEEFQLPEQRCSGMRTGENNLLWVEMASTN